MNFSSALVLSYTNCCWKSKYKGIFVIFVLMLDISEVGFEYNEMSQCIYLTVTN